MYMQGIAGMCMHKTHELTSVALNTTTLQYLLLNSIEVVSNFHVSENTPAVNNHLDKSSEFNSIKTTQNINTKAEDYWEEIICHNDIEINFFHEINFFP